MKPTQIGGRSRALVPHGPRRALLVVSGFLAAALVALTLAPAAEPASAARTITFAAYAAGQGRATAVPDSTAAREKRERGYLARNATTLDAAKGGAAAGRSVAASQLPAAPTLSRSWEGVNDTGMTPPTATGAVGTTRYVELVNQMYAIYDRTNDAPLQTGTLTTLTGDLSGASLFDPQVIWDPDTARFYYVIVNGTTNTLMFGFSTTASPNGSADWCKYDLDFGYGTDFPDYPRLGSTDDFLLVGVNAFNSASAYLGSDILWVRKPATGSPCPTAGTLLGGGVTSVLNADSTPAFTPVPAVQTDPSATGWVVAVTAELTDNELTLFQVTNSGGSANIQTTGTSVPVTSYSIPPDAPQQGTTRLLATLDNRLTQAVSGLDPARGESVIWTQHTVSGAAGSMIRLYEIDPSPVSVLYSASVGDDVEHLFNGAVSSDRRVNGSSRAFGGALGLVFNASSTTTYPSIWALAKPAFDDGSFFLVRQSSGFNQDFSCEGTETICRWGGASASADPASELAGAYGNVWFTNQWNVASSSTSDVDWRTWNGSIEIERSYGMLRVTTSPAVASQIVVDGEIMDSWGLTWVKLPVGEHTVSFTDVPGFATPADQVVNVTEGATTVVTGTFVAWGLQRILTSPAVAGTVSVDGVRRNDWGVWTYLPPGAHQVCFGSVADFAAPSCQNVNVAAGTGNGNVTGTYTSSPGAAGEAGPLGMLRVTTSPAVGSQIRVNGVPMDTWGLTWVKLAPGSYTVSFADVEGFTTPADQVVSVTDGNTTVVTGTFVQRGLLRVLTSPAVAATVYVDGVARNDWGAWTWFPTGSHTVCFDGAPGFTQPACQTINLTTAGATVTGTYTANS
jgi:hypothetical protein